MPQKKAVSTVAAATEIVPQTSSKTTKCKSEVSVEISSKPKPSTKRKAVTEEDDENATSSSAAERPTKKKKNTAAMNGGQKAAAKKGKDVAKANTKIKRSAAGSVANSNTIGIKMQSSDKIITEGENCEEKAEDQPAKKLKTVKEEVSKSAATKAPVTKKSAVKKAVKVYWRRVAFRPVLILYSPQSKRNSQRQTCRRHRSKSIYHQPNHYTFLSSEKALKANLVSELRMMARRQ